MWAIDEVFIPIQGQRQFLWRAVGQDRVNVDILVQRRHNQSAAKLFFHCLFKEQGAENRWLFTDKLRSYPAVYRTVMPVVIPDDRQYGNNRS